MTEPVRTAQERASEDVVAALSDDASAPAEARKLVRSTLVRWGLEWLVDDAELAVSELVTNAWKHGLPPVELTLGQRVGSVRIDVSDMRPLTVCIELPLAAHDAESGRGRDIIKAVSDRSGTDDGTSEAAGKSSYAAWDVDPRTPSCA